MNTRHLKSALAAVMMLFCLQASAQMEFIEKYEDNKKATYVYVGKALFKMLGAKNFSTPGGRDISPIADKLTSLQVVTSEDPATIAEIKDDLAKDVRNYNFEVLLKANDEGEKVTIYFLEGKKENYVLISANEEEETSLIALSGTFTMSDIEKLSKDSNKKDDEDNE